MVATEWMFALPGEVESALRAHAVTRRYPDGALVHGRGDEPEGLYHVVRGAVRISGVSAGGRELLLTVLSPGSWFGEISLLDGRPRTHDAHAVGETELAMVPRVAFDRLLDSRPDLARHIMTLLCARLRLALAALEDATLLPLPARLAKRLLGAADAGGGDVKLPQAQLALLVATSRQSVSKILKQWERRGWISLAYGQVTVLDGEALCGVIEAADRD